MYDTVEISQADGSSQFYEELSLYRPVLFSSHLSPPSPLVLLSVIPSGPGFP